MFCASDAKKLADAKRAGQLADVLKEIEIAATHGYYATVLDSIAYDDREVICEELKRLGFKVIAQDSEFGEVKVYWS